jgi:hypothetical protein
VRAERLEQVFLERKGGVFQVLLVFESPAGARERVRLSAPPGDDASAVDFVARYLERTGATLARRPRLRIARGGSLNDAPDLLARLVAAVAAHRRSDAEST